MSDAPPFKSSPSGLRLKQSAEVREKLRELTAAITKGKPTKDEDEPITDEHEKPEPPKP